MKRLFLTALFLATVTGCTVSHTHLPIVQVPTPTQPGCAVHTPHATACPATVAPSDCYEWALEHGTWKDEGEECPAYSREGENGRCYPI